MELKKKTLLGSLVKIDYRLWYQEESGSNPWKFELQSFQGLCIEVRKRGTGASIVLAHKVGGIWVFRRFLVNGGHILSLKVFSK